MATVILAAAGGAIGGAIGGSVAGVSSVAIGRLVGASVGRLIDQRLMGGGSDVVETGKVDRFRLTGSAEGSAQTQVFGRVRVPGQVIWATRFLETVTESGGGGGGKGSRPSQPTTRQYSYSTSLAIALCEGTLSRVGRVWADGVEISPEDLNMRVYLGTSDQLPDPKMEAVEGAGSVPAYRGTAYVVIEDLELARFGNRVPQFSFEVMRATPAPLPSESSDYAQTVKAVALMPGTGEYSLATTPVYIENGLGETRVANENTPAGKTDLVASMEALRGELPKCRATSLIVSWFGDDLRAGQCKLRPKVEEQGLDGKNMPWHVAGLGRDQALTVPKLNGRPVYGGTPADAAVVEAIRHLKTVGQDVMFYPFILMEQMAGNGRADPWSDNADQAILPWRGRITLQEAPGRMGSPDGSHVADAEVATFFGTAQASDFQIGGGTVTYNGPQEWSYRRFILHNAALCAAAGGVESFCIGSEMRALTQIRGASGFPAVAQLITLAAEARALLGSGVKIGYAADWSEYFGYQPKDGSGNVYFHLDPLWADSNIDFIGIDNYMPLSDWRDGEDHIDAADWPDEREVAYLTRNVMGGEGYEWFYHSPEARAAQIRTPIEDGAYQEPWVFRYKDVTNWWSHAHHERINGVRQTQSTPWVPKSKPIWFTEIGCAAINRGANQPNKFLDEKSSESAMPYFSTGLRDDLMQQAYYEALQRYWSVPANNPVSEVYGGPMLDTARMFAWAWDARPFPAFPNERDLWSDGNNYAKGHWLNGRATNRTLASVVEEICAASGVKHYDVSGLYGVVRGFVRDEVSDGRAALQPLMLRHGFDAVERDGCLSFVMRGGFSAKEIALENCAVSTELEGDVEFQRSPDAEMAGRVRLNFTAAEQGFEAAAQEAILHDEATHAVAQSETTEVLTRIEGRQTAERWLAEARVVRDRVKLGLPLSRLDIGAGDVVAVPDGDTLAHFRLDHVTQQGVQLIEGARVERTTYTPVDVVEDPPRSSGYVPPVPVTSLFLDVPLMTGDEVPYAPHLAVSGRPWPGTVAVYSSESENGYALNTLIDAPAQIGVTQSPLNRADVGRFDRGEPLRVRLLQGAANSVSVQEMLNGANLAYIGDGTPDGWEAFQYQLAELAPEGDYLLSNRLRGQLGTKPAMLDVWPSGSWVVFMSAAFPQISLPRQARGLARHYRVGPAARSLNDPTYTHQVAAFSGVGLKPYMPVHVTKRVGGTGEIELTWIRQTRINGDSWDGFEVPLGEEREAYVVRIYDGFTLMREAHVTEARWTYSRSQQVLDGFASGWRVEVAQVSSVFGLGSTASLAL